MNNKTISQEIKLFKLALSITLFVLALFAVIVIYTGKVSNQFTDKKFYFPEEINIAKPGNLLQVERVTKDSIYLEFKH